RLHLLQLLRCNAVLLNVLEDTEHESEVLLSLLGLAAERRVEGARSLVAIQAAAGRLGQAGVDQRPVEPAARVVADRHGEHRRRMTQRRVGGGTGSDQDEVFLRRAVARLDLEAAGPLDLADLLT